MDHRGFQPSPGILPKRLHGPTKAWSHLLCPYLVCPQALNQVCMVWRCPSLSQVLHSNGVAAHPLPGQAGPKQPGRGVGPLQPLLLWRPRSSGASLDSEHYRLAQDSCCVQDAVQTPPQNTITLGISVRRLASTPPTWPMTSHAVAF